MTSRGVAAFACVCALSAIAGGCTGWDYSDVKPDDPRLLDRACAEQNLCTMTGSAQETTGVTADTKGFRLGPGAGSLRIPMQVARTSDGTAGYVDALVSGRGQLTMAFVAPGAAPNAPRVAIPEEYHWMRLSRVSVPAGVGEGQYPEIFIGVEDGSELDLADLRASGYEQVGSCAAARTGRHPGHGAWILLLAWCVARRRRRAGRAP